MTTFADMGFWLARARVQVSTGPVPDAELLIIEPAEAEEDVKQITIIGLDEMVALRNCIDDEIAKFTHSVELMRQDVPQ